MPTRVRGAVLSTDGRTPASGVQVEAFDPGTGFSQGSTTTDANGNFILSGLEDRTWVARLTVASSNRFIQQVKEAWVEDEPHAQRTTLSSHGHGQLRDIAPDDHHSMVHDHSTSVLGGTTLLPQRVQVYGLADEVQLDVKPFAGQGASALRVLQAANGIRMFQVDASGTVTCSDTTHTDSVVRFQVRVPSTQATNILQVVRAFAGGNFTSWSVGSTGANVFGDTLVHGKSVVRLQINQGSTQDVDMFRVRNTAGTVDFVKVDSAGVFSLSAALAVTSGGTGITTLASGNLALGAGTSAFTALAPGAAGGFVRSDGATWARATIVDADLPATLTATARVAVSKNSGATVGTRRRINFIEGSNVTLTVADDAGNEEVDVTIASSGGAHNLLSATHSDTAVQSPTRGSLIVGNAAGTLWDELLVGTGFLRGAGVGTDPTYAAVNLASADVTGTLPAASLGTHDHSGATQGGATLSPTGLVTCEYGIAADGPLIIKQGSSQTSTHILFRIKNKSNVDILTVSENYLKIDEGFVDVGKTGGQRGIIYFKDGGGGSNAIYSLSSISDWNNPLPPKDGTLAALPIVLTTDVSGLLPAANLGAHDHSSAATGGGTLNPTVLNVKDGDFTLKESADTSKQARFLVNSPASGVPMYHLLPNPAAFGSTANLAALNITQTWTQLQTFQGEIAVTTGVYGNQILNATDSVSGFVAQLTCATNITANGSAQIASGINGIIVVRGGGADPPFAGDMATVNRTTPQGVGQTANIGSTILTNATAAGFYMINIYMTCLATGTGTPACTIAYTDEAGAKTQPTTSASMGSTSTVGTNTKTIYLASGNITWSVSGYVSGTYGIRIRVIYMGA